MKHCLHGAAPIGFCPTIDNSTLTILQAEDSDMNCQTMVTFSKLSFIILYQIALLHLSSSYRRK